MTNKELIDLFYSESLNNYGWDFYDRVDDYSVACGVEVEIDGYIFTADAEYSCGDYEIINLDVLTPNKEEIKLI